MLEKMNQEKIRIKLTKKYSGQASCLLLFFISGILVFNFAHAQGNAGAAKAMNPDIGANFLGTFQRNTSHSLQGFAIQEAEFSLKSDVDPYLTANMVFSVAPSASNPKEYTIEPEEIFVDSTFIKGLTLRAGKFYAAFGKQNLLHTHAFPFIDAPLVNQAILGDGFNEAGMGAYYLIPTTFFSELIVQGFGDFKSLAHLHSLFELSDDSTLEVGATGVTQSAWGIDLTYKHRPTDRGQGRRFNLGIEWMSGSLNGYASVRSLNGGVPQGFTAYTQYEFLPMTYAQIRFEDLISQAIHRTGVLVGFAPSEFSAFRVQYDYSPMAQTTGMAEHRMIAQMNITIGAHPAHDY